MAIHKQAMRVRVIEGYSHVVKDVAIGVRFFIGI